MGNFCWPKQFHNAYCNRSSEAPSQEKCQLFPPYYHAVEPAGPVILFQENNGDNNNASLG